MSNKIKVEEGSGNIFKDLGFSDEVAEEELLKAQLGAEIFRILKERRLTQVEAAKLLGVKQPEISRLKAAKLSYYSVERLMRFLNKLNRDIEIRIIPSEEREGQQAGGCCLVLRIFRLNCKRKKTKASDFLGRQLELEYVRDSTIYNMSTSELQRF